MISHQILVKNYIRKAIEELAFEDLLNIEDSLKGKMEFRPAPDVVYRFNGKYGAYDNLWIDVNSLEKIKNDKECSFSITDFLYETKSITGMDDLTLAQFNEEANQTIFGDKIFYTKIKEIKDRLIESNYHEIDSCLPGHPKILNNKGRLGWGASSIEKYAPEARGSFLLHWIAVKREMCLVGADFSTQPFLETSLSQEEVTFLSNEVNFEEYICLPVHPWQWDRYIKIQYLDMIEKKEIISLGEIGPSYGPQASIRTLSNLRDPEKSDMKLSLSILNTSTVRGIPQRFIEKGFAVSNWFSDLIDKDELLKDKVRIAKESGAAGVKASSFTKFKDSPARFHEMLGCICRDSVPSLLQDNERAMPVAALFFKVEDENFYFIKEIIEKSDLEASEWLAEYFANIFIPLYHLQIKHGIGIVAHGQNLILILSENKPKGVILKDFQGDLRLSTESSHLNNSALSSLTTLPPEYLIHDLITGHLVTVLRYVSRSMEEAGLLEEKSFYQILNQSISKYIEIELEDAPIGAVNLLREEFEKLQVNKVRFEMGYQETSGSPKPLVGKNIKNPIVRFGNGSI